MRTYPPSRALAPFVRVFQVVEAREEATRTLLPEPSIIAGFRYSGSSKLLEEDSARLVPNAALTGLRSKARRMCTSASGGIVLVKFRDATAGAFFSLPLHEVFGETRSLDDVLPRDVAARTAARIESARNDRQRIAIFEELLLELRTDATHDPLVRAAVAALRSNPSLRIGALAGDLRISQDAFEKRFRCTVGASPKQFASLVRLQIALDSRGPSMNLTQLSQRAGYYDQSHFIREFRAATGKAPGRFLSSEEFC